MRVLATSTTETTAAPEAVWRAWTDPALRPAWHPDLRWATYDGPVAPGTTGRWKPSRARPVDVVVTEADPTRRFVVRGTHGLPVARGHYVHELEALPGGGTRITHTMGLTGPAAGLLDRVLGRMLAVSATPDAVAGVARVAEGL